MWRSNMAARKRGEESDFTTGNSELPPRDPLNELVLSRGHGEDVDCSILAMFEDSTVSSESNIDTDEASESLLCALTEMLDRVGQDNDDVDEIFSPFDVLPNTELLHQAEQKDEPLLQKPSPSLRLRPRPKPPNETDGTPSDGKQKVERRGSPKILNKQNPRLFCSKTRRAKSEVEVFTSTSLVSLVKLMHPYCLKLQVEKEEHPRRNKSLFSQEEVWKYERPTEESGEEINVVSDDEAPLKGTMEEEVGGESGSCSLLKSVLLKGKSSREKKRVSFGPVLVASFDESEEEDFKEKNLNTSESTKTLEDASGSVLHPSALPTNEEVALEEQEEKKGETKAKSLSLQEYRQLRLNRRPPVEKQRNYSTKWPSVPEVPKELTLILPLCRPDTTADYSTLIQQASNLKEAKLYHHLHHRRLKNSKPEPRTSPSRPLPDDTARPSISKPESRKSPVKKPKLLSSDPPNPVLVPLPVPQTPSPLSKSVSLHSNKHLHKIQNDSSAAPQVGSSEPKHNASPLNKDVKVLDTPLHQEIKAKLTEMPPHVCTESPQECSLSRTEAAEQSSGPDPKGPVKCPSFTQPLSQSPPSSEVHMMLKEQFPDSECPSKEPEPPQTDCRENSAAIDSGIEAADLTSLLEQFEETQAIEESICNIEAKPVYAASSSFIEANCNVDLDRPDPAGLEQTSKSPLKPNMEPRKPLSTEEILKNVQTLEVPEPLFIEIVLSTQKNQPVRCKNLSLKSIQIIDPRPLPSRKARMSQVEPSAPQTSAQFYSYLSSDHDYCGSVNHSPLQAKQSSELTTPELMTQDSGAAGEGKDHISENPTSALLNRSDQTRTGSETDTSTDEAPQFSSRAAIEGEGRDDNRTALCSLPTPPPTPPVRGRSKRRYRRSPRSDSSSSSSSCSCSPKRPRIHRRCSESSSCSSSSSSYDSPSQHYRMSYSRSRSRSWSRSRSRSPSPQIHYRRWRDVSTSKEPRKCNREHEMRIQKLKAIDERRVVYVGRIRRTMTHDELRERFSQFGEVECVSLHFRDGGDHYGFVTFYNTEDAFAAIDNGGKLRNPDELPFDLCFGGRRQFCNSDYSDLDANRDADPPPPRSRFEDLDFDSLLKQAQRGQKR
ncbi:peroxisome proliferator-activated receptor gamma coactivator-related protein 1-like isoform X1 [Girardinichthys multiradiatus]|uniref:peroxisome proliferator-activated receptor gamma coactivator-related protein 1-like isoform X1 n=1 Tax=Girardinichthys multiradiatus TaxID=208333 RepID=UPI001FACA015|nr:peroxisome proliferator-activated receptor gamma coactivator-related protein 1-like isoform X1 [Girardinichthys multiradiatus]